MKRHVIELTLVIVIRCDADFSGIGKAVLKGALVVFPTDTVFGVGSSPMSSAGILRCFSIKNREPTKRLPILFTGIEEASKFVNFNNLALQIASEFWPGKITIILPAKEIGLPNLAGEERTLAVRVPNHECCQKLIRACGGSLIGTSANVSGQPPFTNPLDTALLNFAGQADYLVSGTCGEDKLASTILDLTKDGQISVKREGAVPTQTIVDHLEKISSAEFSLRTDSS